MMNNDIIQGLHATCESKMSKKMQHEFVKWALFALQSLADNYKGQISSDALEDIRVTTDVMRNELVNGRMCGCGAVFIICIMQMGIIIAKIFTEGMQNIQEAAH